ncbi:MAG TPA: M13 family metallopeptidase [Acidisarcina sp.]
MPTTTTMSNTSGNLFSASKMPMRPFWMKSIPVLTTVLSIAVASVGASAQEAAVIAPAPRPLGAMPYTPSLDIPSMDKSIDPCVDFYQYSCGGWRKANPIPPDQASWSVYGKLANENEQFLWGILEESSKGANRTPTQQKIGDYFGACMNEPAIEKRGIEPVNGELASIAALGSVADLTPYLAHLDHTLPGSFFFNAGSDQDFADASQVIVHLGAGGLGLPDRDYYVKTDPHSVDIRAKYADYIALMLTRGGEKPEQAKSDAAAILAFETNLAKASLTRVERRDPHNLDHKMTVSDVVAVAPAISWPGFLSGVGLDPATVKSVNVTEPKFYEALNAQLESTPLDTLKAYLRFHVVSAAAPYLSHDFAQAQFEFYGHYLRGTPQMRPRWKRCVNQVDDYLGEALGQEFVRRTFGPDTKAKAVQMTDQIEEAMQQEIIHLDWMSEGTKKEALRKLHAVRNKIGYPDTWRDYSALTIDPADYFGNVTHAVAFESRRQWAKVGKPVDRNEWGMTPPTVNAYYNGQMNDINFPAGVLQPPLYDAKLDDAPNYGNTGATIGHELTHGFDDEGRNFDADGNLKDWWTKEDAANFETRINCVRDQYAHYVIVDDIKINSKLTSGEDLADIGGTLLAYIAWKKAEAGKDPQPIDGFSPDQRFFIGMAQWACENERDENLRLSAVTNPHSPGKYRINGVVVNMPEFGQAFQCKAGQPMVKPVACRVW